MTETADRLPDDVAELLSALVDGEVTEPERTDAEAWLARSETARDEYVDLVRVKALLQGLPAVDPPAGFYERLLRRPSRPSRSWSASPAALVASGVATAAAWIVLGGAGATDRLVPPVDDVQGAAVAGSRPVTVMRQDGEVDWDELPTGVRSEVEGTDLWVATGTGPATVVAERAGAVYTLASDELAAVGLVAIVDELPEADDDSAVEDFLDRARNACETLVATFTWR